MCTRVPRVSPVHHRMRHNQSHPVRTPPAAMDSSTVDRKDTKVTDSNMALEVVMGSISVEGIEDEGRATTEDRHQKMLGRGGRLLQQKLDTRFSCSVFLFWIDMLLASFTLAHSLLARSETQTLTPFRCSNATCGDRNTSDGYHDFALDLYNSLASMSTLLRAVSIARRTDFLYYPRLGPISRALLGGRLFFYCNGGRSTAGLWSRLVNRRTGWRSAFATNP